MHIKFNHDFIGCKALEKMSTEPHSKKVWLTWNNDDVLRVFASMFSADKRFKYLEIPSSCYSILPLDTVVVGDRMVGLSTYQVYTVNAQSWFSLAMINAELAVNGTEVSIIWERKAAARKDRRSSATCRPKSGLWCGPHAVRVNPLVAPIE
jgi:vanillate/3-O-methylgallate O-demethylase